MKKIILLAGIALMLGGCSLQTRWGSRLTGAPLDLELPEDCVKVINVSFEPESKSVTCYDPEGNVFSQEYSDFGVFQGRVNWGKEAQVEQQSETLNEGDEQ